MIFIFVNDNWENVVLLLINTVSFNIQVQKALVKMNSL